MARQLRIGYPGAVYLITSRGNEKRVIFEDDHDRETFLAPGKMFLRFHGASEMRQGQGLRIFCEEGSGGQSRAGSENSGGSGEVWSYPKGGGRLFGFSLYLCEQNPSQAVERV